MEYKDGIILKGISGFYYVQTNEKVYECKALGKFRKEGIVPTVGDKVLFEINDSSYSIIKKIYRRKNFLIRPPVSNIDNLIIVVSTEDPAPNMKTLDQLIAVATSNNINPVIIISKTDLKKPDDIFEIYNNSGIKTILFSKYNPNNIEEIKEILKGNVNAFTGNSGVGKSTILNFIDGRLNIQTGITSKKLGRGKHTTRHVELFKLPFGGFVADTPGFSSIDIGKYNMIKSEDLAINFTEFRPFINQCKFNSCSHAAEEGCAVLKAVKDGFIAKSRYNSYLLIYNDLKNIKLWNKKPAK